MREIVIGGAAVLILGLILGLTLGMSAAYDSITDDCRQMKQFRLSDKVFECKLVEKKND